MGNVAAGNVQISAVVRQEGVTAIDERRGKLSLSRSKYLSLIIEKWISDGCPAVSKADHLLQMVSLPDDAAKTKRTPKAG